MNDANAALAVPTATINITWARQQGVLEAAVPFDAPDEDIRRWATEAIRGQGVPGIEADPTVNFTDFVVDRFPAVTEFPENRIFLRPKTPFGYTL